MKVENGTAYLEGKLTLENVADMLDVGTKLMGEGVAVFDLSGLQQVDSSALSLLLGWRRAAAASGQAVSFVGLPDSLLGLAKLYGVSDLIEAS